ncbi:hypothetical protein NLG42_05370 [Flavobacterium plurextorum]|uniref:hypothetical protein n=1 Tax=Flavobacterium TaxID=237 RepID=UPI00214DC956|nr:MULTISPECIES: hypothetical protein [Flavobacterium]UUW10234.1 hypothetical protein NLG42_05370 [Flavobacterium plurextorum]
MFKKNILMLIVLFLNALTYGQKKTPVLQHISSYIITESDTIKIQRINQAERDKLFEIGYKSYPTSQSLLLAVLNIQDYLNHSSRGEKPIGYDYRYNSFDILLNKLTEYAKDYRVYFDLENYKKENLYYVNYPLKNGVRKSITEIFREIDLENERRVENWAIQRKNDSLLVIERRQKKINDSIVFIKQKTINEAKEKERLKQEAKILIAQKKQEIEKKAKRKLDNEKKENERREAIINKYGLVNGEAILNHKVKIGWTKSMCIASWGKPYDINRTTTTYGSHEQYVYSLKKYLYFENGILTAIQD